MAIMTRHLETLRHTWTLRAFGLLRIPLIFFCSPKVLLLCEDKCEVLIPLNYRTKNHWGSMYFGAMAIGADCAPGLLTIYKMRKSGAKLDLIFKNFQAEFIKRPDNDVVFSCTGGSLIQDQIDEAIRTGERITRQIEVQAFCGQTRELVADMTLGLSIKRKG